MFRRELALLVCLVVAQSCTSNMNIGPGGSDGGNLKSDGGLNEACSNMLDDDNDGLTDCGDDDCFMSPFCFNSCLDLCTDGAAICDTAGVKSCQVQASGCRSFGIAAPCNNGLVCSGGTCLASCTDQCTLGAKQCSSTGGVVECQKVGNCTDWVGPTVCQAGEVCSGGACVPQGTCSNQCTQGATRCSGNGLQQTCVKLTSGCTDWTFPTACASGQTCTAATNACAAIPKCTAGDKRCSATTPAVETCDANGAWQTTASCPQACNAGACTVSSACTPGNVRCNGKSVETCNTSGSAWLFTQGCNVACNGGVCNDPCTAGAKRCNGKTVETCGTGATGWTSGSACAVDCYQGACITADLVVDGVTKVLEGDLKYTNSVVVKNGGQIKVGPSGELKLTAASILVDAASNINADSVGGAATVQPTPVQVYSHCHDGMICCNGGYHVYTTVSCLGGQQPGACTGGNPCSGVTPPAQTMRQDDVFVAQGSKYGTTLGGGAVRLIANSIDMQGQLTANSVGTYGYGGGILLAADTITGTGALQATGYYNGMVKILRGASDGFTGSVGGTSVKSVLPPLDVVSGSHPDTTKTYNDGLGDLYLAWSKPFPNVNGYYYAVSQSQGTVPSPSAGTFLQGESLVVKADKLSEGTNYFHIVSVDSTFKFGTVKSYFTVNINSTPPSVSSSSHPYESTWYQNNAVYLTWTDPGEPTDYTGYYYAFDHYADTVPTPAPNNFTDLKQILLSNTADGIWVFHIISRDTRGAVTKEAQHFRVQVGAQPLVDNISGGVFDASNNSAPLSGVTITVNRGLLSTTSTPSGTYTFNGQVWEGTWELTAKKTGYLPQSKTVTVVKGTPLSVNFSLTKAP